RLNGAVHLETEADIASTGGNITFTSSASVDSQDGTLSAGTSVGTELNNLVLDAGAGRVFFNADLGKVQHLGSLMVTRADSGVAFGQSDANTGLGGTGPVNFVNADTGVDIGTLTHVISGTGIVLNGGSAAGAKLSIAT